ncbi:MAG: hypothetical protein SPI61_00415 [Ezakiella sp.]|uniref:hypothetical protein n=1 Tax=Ezakiella sp. TaxID=1935205 RepID=UPI0029768092|nr:hypothetical protein [Ezakiella sp.]MDD7730965.1 hypothetical protein [Eubacteriales bacterium]MDY6079192.1 hypothetical protein [Ezakiella sp.]
MLTTKDFIKEVKAIGFVAIAGDGYFIVKDSKGYNVAFVDTTIMYRFDTIYIDFEELSEFDRKRLFDLLVKYASTPLEDREAPQKFYLKFKLRTSYSDDFLNRNTTFDWFEINTKSNSDKFQTQFTQKEIDEMKVKFGVALSDFEQIPVEEIE